MDAQIENAVEILGNPRSEPSLKQRAFDFVDQLRSDPGAWQVCAGLFTREPRASDLVRMACLEIVNYAVHNQGLDTSTLAYLKDSLLVYVRRTYSPDAQLSPDPASIQNKLVQTLTYLFVFLYQDGWQSFMGDFMALTGSEYENTHGVALYLRVLSSIHDEIADMLLTRHSGDAKRNTDLKDRVRAQDMHKIAQSWKDILGRYVGQNDGIVDMVMRVIGKWVGWMDISLVIDSDMLGLLLPVVGRSNDSGRQDQVRNSAINTLTEIVGKKMKPGDKMQLIRIMNLHEIVARLIASPSLADLMHTSNYDTDLAEVVAKLVNTVMADIVKALEESGSDMELRSNADRHLQDFLPLLLRFFSDEYDEVCSSVIPSLTDLLAAMRKIPNRPQSYSDMLPPILNAVIMKMRYDDTASWGDEDEKTDEAEFAELRKRLQVLQKSIEAVNQDLFVDVLSNLVGNAFQTLEHQGSHMDWRDLDLALHEMELFGELALPNQGLSGKNQPSAVVTERLAIMLTKMVESGIAHFGHPCIALQYMELCVRYAAFFESHQEFIPRVLENFVRLIHLNHVRVKQRSWYLFYRIVKQLRAYVGNVSETVIQSIHDLLPIRAEVPSEEVDDDMSSDAVDQSADALFTGQIHLYTAIGVMLATKDVAAETRASWLRAVTEPLFGDLEQHIQRARGGEAQALLQVHHMLMAMGTVAYGVGDATPGAGAGSAKHNVEILTSAEKALSDEFARVAEAVLIALRELHSAGEIRQAARSAFSRLIGVLGSAVLPQLPQWIEGLLSSSSSNDEMAMFLRLLDQVIFGFKAEIYDVLNLLLTPLLERCFAGLAEPVSGTDDVVQMAELRREYLSFLNNLLTNNLEEVFISEQNQGFFERLISSVLALACHVESSTVSSRLAFGIMTRMATIWGGPDVATISANPTAPSGPPSPVIPGFDTFLLDRFHDASWKVMQNSQFRPSTDAQSKQLLGEIAGLEQTIYLKTGNLYMQSVAKLGVSQDEYMMALATSTDRKKFAGYLGNLIKNRG